VPPLLIIVGLFAVMYVLMIRPQRAKAQQQRRMLGTVAAGDEVLTVGGIYGIVQEIEPDEDGGDLIVEIAEGIHVRVARKALATVVKPEDDEDEDDDEDDDDAGEDDAAETDDVHVDDDDHDAEPVAEHPEPPAGVAEVNGEQETVNPGTADEAASPGRS
jgi:preprotein translocase subunit YajC